jgi:hypothetical protein
MNLLTLIVQLPLAGFLLNGLAGPRLGKGFVSVVGCGLPILAFMATVRAFMQLNGAEGAALVETAYTWAVVGDFSFDIAFYFDRLSGLMTLIVTGVGSLIHVYSTGYMKDDASYARYFSYLNLFLFFMLLLVLGRSLLVPGMMAQLSIRTYDYYESVAFTGRLSEVRVDPTPLNPTATWVFVDELAVMSRIEISAAGGAVVDSKQIAEDLLDEGGVSPYAVGA